MDTWNLKGGRIKYLTEYQMEEIHLASLKVLQETGIFIEDEGALKTIEEHGCKVDHVKKRAWIPTDLVEQCLALTPDRVNLATGNPKYDLQLEKERVYFGLGTQALYVLDIETGEKSFVNEQDIYDFPRFIDTLEYQGFYKNCTKVISLAAFSSGSALAGGKVELAKRPYVSMNVLSVSPLRWSSTNINILKICAENRVPLIISSEPPTGTNPQVTLVGAIMMGNAENLAAITLAQLYSPGTPVIYGSVGSPTDMKTSYYASGAIGLGIMNVMANQMSHFYSLPHLLRVV